MKNFKTKNITLMEKIETIEAENLYHKMKTRFSFLYIIPLIIIFLLLIIIVASDTTQQTALISLICNVGLEILGISTYRTLMKPFKELLDVAKHNDWIRHEERIRYKERKRILNEEKNKYSVEDVKQTIQEYKEIKSDIKKLGQ